jgi:hypothetical protein
MKQPSTLFTAFYYSLPVRLVVRQLQHHKVLLLFWLLLLGVLSGWIGQDFGGAYLLLEPEYLGRESFESLFIVGSALGGFLFAYMITFYINESYRFPFLVQARHPFYLLSFNNLLVPGSFLLLYFYKFVHYHSELAGGLTWQVVYKVGSLGLGIAVIFLLAASYFFARRGLFSRYSRKLEEGMAQHRGMQNSKVILERAKESFRYTQRADSYLIPPLRVVTVRPEALPPFRSVVRSLNQHHGKILLLQIFVLGLIAALGLLEENPYFQIPAGASFMLIAALGLMAVGAVSFWFRKTGAFTVLAFLGLVVCYNQFDQFRERHQAFGLNYAPPPAAYTIDRLRALTADSIYQADRAATLASLEAWKDRQQARYGQGRPRLVLVTASGGGLRSAFWTFHVMQHLDSLSQGRLMDETRLMTGASGGMFGLSYFRELYWRQQQGQAIDLQAPHYREHVSRDLLNRVLFKIFTDIALPIRQVQVGDQHYDGETGYSFDQQLARNLPELEGRRLGDYRAAEARGEIPYLVLSPTVINQGRQLYLSASPMSYLARPNQLTEHFLTRSRGVEFRRLFARHEPDSLLMTTALRMNATFPVILPIVALPSEPVMEVMDAGAIDNYGTQTAVKFLYEFHDWIRAHTSQVMLLQIRDNDRLDPIRPPSAPALRSLITPIFGGYYSMAQTKDVTNDYLLELLKAWYQDHLEVVTIEYPKETNNQPVSLSLHLTQREKKRLKGGIHVPQNDPGFTVLYQWYSSNWIADKNSKTH